MSDLICQISDIILMPHSAGVQLSLHCSSSPLDKAVENYQWAHLATSQKSLSQILPELWPFKVTVNLFLHCRSLYVIRSLCMCW